MADRRRVGKRERYSSTLGGSAKDDGGGKLSTYNGKGQELVELGASEGKGMLITFNGKGQEVVMLGNGVVATLNDNGRITGTMP